MQGWFTHDQYELLERQRADFHETGRYDAAARVAHALYTGAPRRTVAHGRAARNLAAARNRMGKHFSAWHLANEAVAIHTDRLRVTRGDLNVLGERAASVAYAGAVGLMLVLGGPDCEAKQRQKIAPPALHAARWAMADFGLYRELNGGRSHRLELQHLPHISVVESILGDRAEGQQLAHDAYERAGAANDDAVRQSAFGAMIVTTMLDVGEKLPRTELYHSAGQVM